MYFQDYEKHPNKICTCKFCVLMGKKINIAIDGHSSCGKSTIAKSISKKFHMRYIDTGAMYRAVTLFCLKNNLIFEGKVNVKELKDVLDDIILGFTYDNEKLNRKKKRKLMFTLFFLL